VAPDGPVIVQDYEEVLVREDHFAGVARFVAENAGHLYTDSIAAVVHAKTRRREGDEPEPSSRLRGFA
jgi:hypothetical protein